MRRGLKPMVQRVQEMMWCRACQWGMCDSCENLMINPSGADADEIVIVCEHSCDEDDNLERISSLQAKAEALGYDKYDFGD